MRAVVGRGPFLSSSGPLLLLRPPLHLTYLKVSFDFTRPAAGRTRPRAAAPLAVAFVTGQHRPAHVDPRPATRITFTAAPALGTGSRRGRHQAPPLGFKDFFDQRQPLALPRDPAAEAARAFHVNVPAGGVPLLGEEPPGTTLPSPTGGTFAPQAEQFLAIEDGTRRPVRP